MRNGYRWEAQIRTLALLLLVAVAGCSSAQPGNLSQWQSQLHSGHPLVGKIWSSADARFIEPDQLLETLADFRYLLLGEKHDNPDHHRLQLLVLQSLLQQNKVGLIAFEMLTTSAQSRLDAMRDQRFSDLEAMKTHLVWDEAGWEWSFYGPLVQAGHDAGVRLMAANIDDNTMMQVYGGEVNADLGEVLESAVMDKLLLDIDESHCGLLPESQFPAMVRVQQSRDLQMAKALSGNGGDGGAEQGSDGTRVLIAGNYHVREDLGVPNYLRSLHSDLTLQDMVTVAFTEVAVDSSNPADYLEQFSAVPAFDFIWFTRAISDEDYCASLQQSQ